MKFTRLSSALQNYEQRATLSVEDTLGLIQDLCKDVRRITGSTVDLCAVADPDTAVSRLIWLSGLVGRIYESHQQTIGEAYAHERATELRGGVQDILRRCEDTKRELDDARAAYTSAEQEAQRLEQEWKELTRERDRRQDREAYRLDLRRRCEALRAELALLRNGDTERLQKELDSLDGQVNVLREQRDALEQAHRQKADEVQMLLGAYKSLSERVEQLQEQKRQLAWSLEEGERSRDGLTAEIAARNEQFEQMKRELVALTDELELQQQSNETYRRETLDAARQTLGQAQQEGERLAAQHTALREEYEVCCKRNQELLQGAQALETERKQLDSAYEVAQTRQRKRQEALAADRERLRELEEELERLTQTLAAQEEAVKTAAVENNRLRLVELPGVQTELDDAKALQSKLQAQKAETEAALGALQGALTEALRAQKEREDAMQGTQARRQDAADRLTRLNAQIRALDEETSRLTTEHETLERELTEKNPAGLRERLNQLVSEKKRLLDECRDMSREIGKQETALEQERQTLTRKRDRRDALSTEITQVEQELYAVEQELAVLKSDSVQQSVQKKRARLQMLREISEELRRDSAVLQEVTGQSEGWKLPQVLQSRLGGVENTLQELQEQIKRYGNSLDEEVLR